MATGFPHQRVHEDGSVDTDDVLVEQYHRLPPVLFDIIFKLDAVLSIVVDGGQAIVDFTAWEDEAVFLAMAYNLLEYIFLCHNDI